MTYTLDTQLKSITARDEQQAQDLRDETRNLRVDFNKEINAAQQNFQTQLETVKAAAWLPARLREVTRGPVGMPPTPPECHRDGRQVCKRCGKPGHLWRKRRYRQHEKNHSSEVRKRPPTSPPSHPRFTPNVLAKRIENSLMADVLHTPPTRPGSGTCCCQAGQF
jgi:hypothetical protein